MPGQKLRLVQKSAPGLFGSTSGNAHSALKKIYGRIVGNVELMRLQNSM